MAFLAIEPTPGLSPEDRRRAGRAGPTAVAVRTSYPSLLKTAGFVDVGVDDVTGEYRRTQAAWIDAYERRAIAISGQIGDTAFRERTADRARSLAAIDAGLLARFMYWARRL